MSKAYGSYFGMLKENLLGGAIGAALGYWILTQIPTVPAGSPNTVSDYIIFLSVGFLLGSIAQAIFKKIGSFGGDKNPFRYAGSYIGAYLVPGLISALPTFDEGFGVYIWESLTWVKGLSDIIGMGSGYVPGFVAAAAGAALILYPILIVLGFVVGWRVHVAISK